MILQGLDEPAGSGLQAHVVWSPVLAGDTMPRPRRRPRAFEITSESSTTGMARGRSAARTRLTLDLAAWDRTVAWDVYLLFRHDARDGVPRFRRQRPGCTSCASTISRVLTPTRSESRCSWWPPRSRPDAGHTQRLGGLQRAPLRKVRTSRERPVASRGAATAAVRASFRLAGEISNRRERIAVWNSFPTDGPVGVPPRSRMYGWNGDTIHAYVARPVTDGTASRGIVLIHHLPGWDEFYQEFAERLARHGYTVICPDLYCRYGHGTPTTWPPRSAPRAACTTTASWPTARRRSSGSRPSPTDNGKVGDHRLVLGRPARGARRLAGARASMRSSTSGAAAWSPQRISSTPARPSRRSTTPPDLDAPLLGLFGNDDQAPVARGRSTSTRPS